VPEVRLPQQKQDAEEQEPEERRGGADIRVTNPIAIPGK